VSSLQSIQQDVYNSTVASGDWIDPTIGNAFIGQLSVKDSTIPREKWRWLPHGAGKWTLSDGTIIEGENVAVMGEIIR
jgi:hypothetical protein